MDDAFFNGFADELMKLGQKYQEPEDNWARYKREHGLDQPKAEPVQKPANQQQAAVKKQTVKPAQRPGPFGSARKAFKKMKLKTYTGMGGKQPGI